MNFTNDDDVYSAWKFAHHPERIDAVRERRPVIPANLQIDLEGRCNHNCRFCAYRNAGFDEVGMRFTEPVRLSRERGLRLVDEIHELEIPSVEITGGGESMLWPWIEELLERLAHTELAIVTHGHSLRPSIVDRIHRESLRWIRFSLDSCTPATHAAVHRVKESQFPRVLDHMSHVLNRGFPHARIGVSFVVVPENVHEIVAAARFWKAFGVHNIRYSFTYDSGYQGRLTAAERERVFGLIEQARGEQDAHFRVFGWKDRLDNYTPGNSDFASCGYQFGTIAIGNDGGVWPCCIVKYYPAYAIGNINEQSLAQILLGPGRETYLKTFDPKGCPPCWLRDKNKFIEALADGRTRDLLGERHAEFERYARRTDAPHLNFP